MKIKIKPIKELKAHCGPASLKMVMDHYGTNFSQRKIAKEIGSTAEAGWDEADMVKAAKKLGFKAYWKENSCLEELRELNKKGIPVIVGWFPPETAWGHYSVVVDINTRKIKLADSMLADVRGFKLKRFMLRWFDLINTPPMTKKDLNIRPIIVIEKKDDK